MTETSTNNTNMSENVTKFTEQEMQSIGQLQGKYQQKIFELGQLELAKVEMEQQVEKQKTNLATERTKVFDEWKKIQTEETTLLQELSQKYGDGTLSLKDGTFTPAQPLCPATPTAVAK